MKLIFDPNPFCYGSTATMLAILEHLPDTDIAVLADGPTPELCGHLDTIHCNVKNPDSVAQHADTIRKADVYVAIGNNTNVTLARRLGVPLVFVDTLYWMKRQHTPAMEHAHVYAIENYPGVDQKLRSMTPRNPLRVGPILDVAGSDARQRQGVMANLGGAASPDIRPGENTQYPHHMTAMMGRIARSLKITNLPVAMGQTARESVAGSHVPARPVTLPHDIYLTRLRRSGVLVTSPGLNGPLEAFLLGVPVVFLPPQNLTQIHHLAAYEAAGLARPGRNLVDLVPELDIDPLAPERAGTQAVLRALGSLSEDTWHQIENLVETDVRRALEAPASFAMPQRQWLESLGTPGAPAIAAAIVEAAQCA